MSIPNKRTNGLRYLTVQLPLRTLIDLESCALLCRSNAATIARIMIEGAIPALKDELANGTIVVTELPKDDPDQDAAFSFRHLR